MKERAPATRGRIIQSHGEQVGSQPIEQLTCGQVGVTDVGSLDWLPSS